MNEYGVTLQKCAATFLVNVFKNRNIAGWLTRRVRPNGIPKPMDTSTQLQRIINQASSQ
jgi:hypothetical protein